MHPSEILKELKYLIGESDCQNQNTEENNNYGEYRSLPGSCFYFFHHILRLFLFLFLCFDLTCN